MALGMSAPPLSRPPRDGRPLDRDDVTNRIGRSTVGAGTPNIRRRSALS
jgi:hypothetical protein